MTSHYVSIPIIPTYKSQQMINIERVKKNYIHFEHS
jgi:hypothetical protein